MNKPELKENEAFCIRCQKIKEKKEFYLRKDSGNPLSYCMVCQEEIKELKFQENIERIVIEKGGVCQDCKETYPAIVYDFYLEEKGRFNLNKAKHMSFERMKENLNDYLMLCKNCRVLREWVLKKVS